LAPGEYTGGHAVGAAPVLAALAAWLCTFGCGGSASPEGQPQRLPTAAIRVGDLPLTVEVANDYRERERGMMFRRRLGPDEAMLFVFPLDLRLGFWMKNCYVDLDLAYIRADGTIAQVEHLEAHNEAPVPSHEPVRFVLELPAGWLKAHGVGVGTKVTIPPAALEGVD
jgi:hypothetical protein